MAGEWISQLPEDLRTNEAFTGHATLGDFAKSHLEAQGKLKEFDGKVKELDGKVVDLTGKLTNSIPKLPEKATDEQMIAFYKALGRPDKPEDYEIPKRDGVENDEKMVQFGRTIFHKANLNKEQGKVIAEGWNDFITEYNKALIDLEKKSLDGEAEKLKKELGDKYGEQVELGKRFFKKIMESDFDEKTPINSVTLLRIIIKAANLVGEGMSPPGSSTAGGDKKLGLKYKKIPT
jgi:uncharacterized protein YjbJ (UPF0337 family)